MAVTRGKRRVQTLETPGDEEQQAVKKEKIMEAEEVSGYEQCRDKRIKENMERMQKLGLLDLSRKLKSENLPPKRSPTKPSERKKPQSLPQRRSSRLENAPPVQYAEVREPKEKKRAVALDIDSLVGEGSEAEIYTEEHDKLLGTCESEWVMYVDGYGSDGKRIYDPVKGETCHQCRQKTLGYHTHCSKCKIVQGQLCGDCLYMRYGENVLEANKNRKWICPCCRGICNCSLCRKAKGWLPTGNLYRKVTSLGFKSVAHFLIQTRRAKEDTEDPAQLKESDISEDSHDGSKQDIEDDKENEESND